DGFVATTSNARTESASRAAVGPASSSDDATGRRGTSRCRATIQPRQLRTAKPARARVGQAVAGETSGGRAVEGAAGHAPASANSSKIAALQSQKPARLR